MIPLNNAGAKLEINLFLMINIVIQASSVANVPKMQSIKLHEKILDIKQPMTILQV
jgi:hypothetical protein